IGTPFQVSYGQTLVGYVLLNECQPPTRIMLQYVTTDGGQHTATWGAPLNNTYQAGPLPATGAWARLELPASVLSMENTSGKTIVAYQYDVQAWFDHIGSNGIGCTPAVAPAPTIPSGDTVWVDDTAPSGATVSGVTWDTTQKASGMQSFTHVAAPGESFMMFS